MSTTTNMQPLITTPMRIGGALAAVAIIAVASFTAGAASERAVASAQAAFHPAVMYVKLQPVEIVGRRDTALAEADTGCPAPRSRT